jgi:hypothetical protein
MVGRFGVRQRPASDRRRSASAAVRFTISLAEGDVAHERDYFSGNHWRNVEVVLPRRDRKSFKDILAPHQLLLAPCPLLRMPI